MFWFYFYQEKGLFYVLGSGKLRLNPFINLVEIFQEELKKDPSLCILAEFREAVPEFSIPVFSAAVQEHRDKFSPPKKMALLVGGKLGYGLARLYQQNREKHGEEGFVNVFMERDEACKWLGLPDDWQPPSQEMLQAVTDQ